MKNGIHLATMFVPLLYLAAQLATGTNAFVACLFSAAILFGLYAVWAAGGLVTALGALNATLIGKFLLIAIALKVAIQDPADKNLLAAQYTAATMALGFFGLLVAMCALKFLPRPRRCLMEEVNDAKMYLVLTIVFLICGYGGYLVGMGPELTGQGAQTGGILGIARVFGNVKAFAIVPALYFAWAQGGRRFMTHPLVLAIFGLGVAAGILSTSKLDAMQTPVFYALVGFARYGWRDKRLLALSAAAVIYYGAIIYPYSQYVRSHGGRDGTPAERIEAVKEVFGKVATNSEFRSNILEKTEDPNGSYLDNVALKPFARLAMVGEADKLIAASVQNQSWTGWETILWGVKLALPSLIYPEKPIFGTGNYLARIAGEVGNHDTTTQVSYGVIANFFNAFSFPGAFLGTAIFFACFYYVLQVCFGNPKWSNQPLGSTIWFLFVFTTFEHVIVEESVAGLMAYLLNFMLVVSSMYFLARTVFQLLVTRQTLAVRR